MNKLNFINILKWANHKWLYMSSYSTFFIGFMVSIIFLMIFKNKMIFQISNYIFIVFLIYRIIYQFIKIKNLKYYSLKDEKQVHDRKMRGYQIGDVVSLTMILILSISENSNFMNQNENSLLWVILSYSIIFLVIASLAIIKNNIFLRTISVMLSTIQGLIIFLSLSAILLIQIKSLMEGDGFYIIYDGTGTDSVGEMLIKLSFVFEQNPMITIVTVIISILLYASLIVGTPTYQQEQLALSFKIITIVIALLGIITFFLANFIELNIPQDIKEIIDNFANEEVYVDEIQKFVSYYQGYSKENILNLFYLLFLPYTFGIIVSELIMDLKKRRNTRNVDIILERIIELKLKKLDILIDNHLKKYLYYGGDKKVYEISINQIEIEKILYELKNRNYD